MFLRASSLRWGEPFRARGSRPDAAHVAGETPSKECVATPASRLQVNLSHPLFSPSCSLAEESVQFLHYIRVDVPSRMVLRASLSLPLAPPGDAPPASVFDLKTQTFKMNTPRRRSLPPMVERFVKVRVMPFLRERLSTESSRVSSPRGVSNAHNTPPSGGKHRRLNHRFAGAIAPRQLRHDFSRGAA